MDYVCSKGRDYLMLFCANPHAQYLSHKEQVINAVANVLESQSYILGSEVEKFEKSFAEYCGVTEGVGVNSGTDALMLSLRALDVGPGDEVITVSHTALATISAIIAVGATPVLVDIESDYYTMDPQRFRDAVSPKTKAVIPVHLYGQPADMDAILNTAREYNLYVIEDCAQAAGAIYKGRRVGSLGDVGCFSFYPTKNLGAIGDGGMVVTNNQNIAERVRRLGQYGWDENRMTTEPGINSRLDEIQAAILNVKLKNLDVDNEKRKNIAFQYNKILSSSAIVLPKERPSTTHVYHLYVISLKDRDELKDSLKKSGVMAGIHYKMAAHQHQGYDLKCSFLNSELPKTNKAVGNILSLPMYPEISSEQMKAIDVCISNNIER